MRKLKLVVRTAAGTLPLVVAAQVEGCNALDDKGEDRPDREPPSSGTTRAGAGGFPGTSPTFGDSSGQPDFGDSDFGNPTSPPVQIAPPPVIPSPSNSCELTVELPEPGTPAEPGQICAATMLPVESNRAARVTLENVQTGELRRSRGFIAIDPELQSLVVGEPTVELLEVTHPGLEGAELTMLQPGQADMAAFTVLWPESLFSIDPREMARVTFRVNLELECGDETQVVHSATDVHLCDDFGRPTWASTGDVCSVCRIIAEMAPSPIVPDTQAGELPLSRAVRLRIVELARVSETVVLLAENDGGDDMDYQWHASAGTVQQLAPDVVAWSLSDGLAAPFIQAAVTGEHGAAVSTFSFNDRVG